ncbi:restriction endonuclease subunit S [Facklamia miroungae]|uniref:Type I restriction enzyme, S subunit n=1 Tax=Facklamia miroungae TaxID=120956 RepID=A0A1G7RF30_9LACT|nr:restriction endonuclease subunit S [Facklamia miroungae]NKZ29437.1 restriction endonuclease subunit S [Facklamia miroungae]SDG09358.1 type I restriction enzyme, S subunit [Facklamia miroungae]
MKNNYMLGRRLDWFDDIPEPWKVFRLKDVVKINNGKDYKDIEVEEDGYPVIGSGGEFARASNFMCNEESVLFGRKGTVDRPLFLKEPFWTVDTMFYSTKKKKINMKYLYYCSLCFNYDYYMTSTALPSMTQGDLGNILIPFPDKSEQNKIVEELDSEVEKIDTLILKTEKQIEILEKYKKSLITEIATKGLDERIQYKNTLVNWIKKVPVHWDVKKLKYILSDDEVNMRVGPFGSALSGNDFKGEGRWVYNQRTVLDDNFKSNDTFINEDKWRELKSFKVEAKDILLTTRGTIGKVAIVPEDFEFGIIHPCLIKFRINNEMISNKILKYIFNETDIVRDQLNYLSNSTTIDVIYSYNLKNIYLPVIPKEEQPLIEVYLDKNYKVIRNLIEGKKNQIDKLIKYKNSAIYEYVSGKRRVGGFNNGD